MPLDRSEVLEIADRLDHDYIERLSRKIIDRWHSGVPSFEVAYMPGDGTHYGLFFALLSVEIPLFSAEGGGTMGWMPTSAFGVRRDGTYVLLTYIQRNASFLFHCDEFVAPEHVESETGTTPASALAIAVLLNEITEASPGWVQRAIDTLREGDNHEQ